MNPALAEVTSRIAALTSVQRSRKDDETRAANHGSDGALGLSIRQMMLVQRLRDTLTELEETLA